MKNKTFAFRISERDLNAARRKATMAKLTVTDYFTACALGKEIVVVEGLPELVAQLKGIGRNLNQLTTLANMGRIQAEQLRQQSAMMAGIAERIAAQAEKTDKLLERTSQQAGKLHDNASSTCRELTDSLCGKLRWLTGKVFLFMALAEALLLTSYLLLKLFLK